jgi:hypothetical protein
MPPAGCTSVSWIVLVNWTRPRSCTTCAAFVHRAEDEVAWRVDQALGDDLAVAGVGSLAFN